MRIVDLMVAMYGQLPSLLTNCLFAVACRGKKLTIVSGTTRGVAVAIVAPTELLGEYKVIKYAERNALKAGTQNF